MCEGQLPPIRKAAAQLRPLDCAQDGSSVAFRQAGQPIALICECMTPRYRLHYAPDNASLIIRLVLTELDQTFETVLVDRAAQEQTSPAYLRLNPHGMIPVLETPDGPVFETAAILLWLTEQHGALAPQPGDAQRADFLKWLFFVSNTLHSAMRMTFYPHRYVGAEAPAQADLRHHLQGEIAQHLDRLERLAASHPDWLNPDGLNSGGPSCLNFYLACLFRWLALYPAPADGGGWFQLSRWPHLYTMAERLEHCQSVATAIKAEGLGPQPFTSPQYATPPEGSAT